MPLRAAPGDDPAIPFRSTGLSLESLDSQPGPKFLYDYWQRKLRGRRMPARSDIDPIELKAVLPSLILLDVQPSPLDFRYRLAGTRTYDIFGLDLTGRSVRELGPRAVSEGVWASLVALARDGIPQYVKLEFTTAAGYGRSFQVLRLPLGDDGKTVDRVLVMTTFERGRGP